MAQKEKIYYARMYRHLKLNVTKSILYFSLLVMPCFSLFILNLYHITHFISNIGIRILGRVFVGLPMKIMEDQYSIIGRIEYIELPTVYPDVILTFWNLVVMLGIFIFLGTGRRKGRPLAIYLMLSVFIHIINCLYFLFAASHFPYQASEYSNLYIKQEIGIWLTFIILCGLVTGFLGNKGYLYKIITFFSVLIYSVVFGTVRYILFLFLLEKFSVLYMALMFFSFGPLFDFLYLVGIYSVFVNKMVKIYDTHDGKEEWKWA